MYYFSKINNPKKKFIKLRKVFIVNPAIKFPIKVKKRQLKNRKSILPLPLTLINKIKNRTEFAKQNKNTLFIIYLLKNMYTNLLYHTFTAHTF